MALINRETQTIHCKVVYYGPGMAGKTSNLHFIHRKAPSAQKGDLLSIATETERTLFFDFTPDVALTIRGYSVRFHLYTVPGCVWYEETKQSVLRGVDGIIFVADSQRNNLQRNIDSLQEMVRGLYYHEKSIETIPVVLQYNKRDLPNILPIAVLDKYLNPLNWPRFESTIWLWNRQTGSRHVGHGALETFAAIQTLVLENLRPKGSA